MAEIKDFARMCNEYHHDACYEECPIGSLVDRYGMIRDCLGFMRVYPKEADRTITEWCKENPQKNLCNGLF